MKRQLLIATTAMTMVGYAALATTTAHAADCDGELDRLNNEILTGDKNYRIGALSGMEREVRQLSDAARIFAVNGNDEACADVVEGIEDMLETRQAKIEEAKEEKLDNEGWTAQERSRIKNAKSLSAMTGSLTASKLIGADVRNMQNDDLGEVDDVALAPGSNSASYLIVSHGGFLGIGEDQIAVPMSSVKVTAEGEPVVVLNMTEEQLEKAPSFKRDENNVLEKDEWRMKNDKFFSQKK